MRRHLLALTLLFVCFTFAAHAQQDPLYSLYLNNPITINPAYTGLNDNFAATIGYRKQWAGIAGSPTTGSFTAQSSINQNKMGAGLVVINDQLGEVTNLQITGSWAYKLKLDEDRILSFGMQGGVLNYKTDGTKVNLQTPGDEAFASTSQVKPMLGAGLILKSEKYMLGLSVPRLLNSSFTSNGTTYNPYQQQYYLFGTYIFPLSERVQFRPSTLIRYTTNSPVSTDLNLNLNVDRLYTVGLFTRNLNTYGILLQGTFDEYFRISGVFEKPTSKSIGSQFNTFEINLGIKLNVLSFHNRSITNF